MQKSFRAAEEEIKHGDKIKVISGAPCSGKTTYVKSHIGDADLAYDYDALYCALTFKGSHTEPTQAQHDMVSKLRCKFLFQLKESQAPVAWVIATRPTEWLRQVLGEEAEYIAMNATRQECLERLQSDDTRRDKDLWAARINRYFDEQESAATTGKQSRVPCMIQKTGYVIRR